MIPAAANAIASGSNRMRWRKTSSRAIAITIRTAISIPAMDPEISDERSCRTTGTPLTV